MTLIDTFTRAGTGFLKEVAAPRFSKDWRVKMLGDVSEFASVENFKGGLLCPYDPFSADDLKEIEAFVAEYISFTPYEYRDLEFNIYEHNYWKPYGPTLPQPLTNAVEVMKGALSSLTGRPSDTLIRVNSSFPVKPHNHKDPSLTYTLNGVGTIGRNILRQEYETPLRHIFAFDRSIWHKASKFVSADTPKLTVIIAPQVS